MMDLGGGFRDGDGCASQELGFYGAAASPGPGHGSSHPGNPGTRSFSHLYPRAEGFGLVGSLFPINPGIKTWVGI